MFVLEWLHYIIAWCVSHMFQVMANGETFGRSLILTPHQNTPSSGAGKASRATPNRSHSTPKTSLYRRLSARLSGRRNSPPRNTPEDRERRLQAARCNLKNKQAASSDDVVDFSISYLGHSYMDDQYSFDDQTTADHVELRKNKSSDKENKDVSQTVYSPASRVNAKDKREVFKNKSMNVFNLVDCLTEAASLRSSLTKSLCDLDSKEEPGLLLPTSKGSKELQQSTTTISSGKKRSRNSTDSNFQVSAIDANVSPDKGEDSHWKSIKRLKIKDSFKFKNRPTIFKRSKKDCVSKTSGDITVEPVSPESVKPTDPAGEFVASTSSPIREDDNTSICSMNTSKQSGFFDISFASIRSSKTVKSASKLRRSVKSFTASFRSERKKKYEKRTERNTVDVNPSHLPRDFNNVSTPKAALSDMTLDISPVQVDTVDSTNMVTPIRANVDELDDSTIFKTPQSVWLRTQRHSICGGVELRQAISSVGMVPSPSPCPVPSPLPSPGSPSARPRAPQPPRTASPPTAVRAISQCHGISLPVLTPFNLVQ